ncbi:hypothetical protein BC941DRAFT_423563 [Chlamydoabsidia padenii]|nr:hypothetical protein BC941DRAFT_423563 [Chlamydoabsidia padenii]
MDQSNLPPYSKIDHQKNHYNDRKKLPPLMDESIPTKTCSSTSSTPRQVEENTYYIPPVPPVPENITPIDYMPPSDTKHRRFVVSCCKGLLYCFFLLFFIALLLGVLYFLPADRCCKCLRAYDRCTDSKTNCMLLFNDCTTSVFGYFHCDQYLFNRQPTCWFNT